GGESVGGAIEQDSGARVDEVAPICGKSARGEGAVFANVHVRGIAEAGAAAEVRLEMHGLGAPVLSRIKEELGPVGHDVGVPIDVVLDGGIHHDAAIHVISARHGNPGSLFVKEEGAADRYDVSPAGADAHVADVGNHAVFVDRIERGIACVLVVVK